MPSKIIKLILIGIALIGGGCISPELRSAKIAMQEKDWERALGQLELELQRTTPTAEVYYLIGYCYQNMGRWGEMSAYYDSSLAISSQFASKIESDRQRLVASYYRKAAQLNEDSTRVKEALAVLDTCLIIDPHQVDLYATAAVWAYESGWREKAIKYAERGIAREKTPQVVLREVLMLSYQLQDELEKAAEYARQIMSLVDPSQDTTESYLRAFDVLIAYYGQKRDWGAAEQALQEILNYYPQRIDIKLNLALTMLQRENLEGAKYIYMDILQQDPENFDANLNLGTILANERKWSEAIPYLEMAHRLDPTNRIAVQNLMACYYNTDQIEKGEEMRKKYEELTR